MKFAFAFAFLVALGGALPARADALSDGVAALPGSVEDVRIAGTWEKDGRAGVYRVVIARTGGEAMTARMFVQWVAYGDGGAATVESSVEIAEIAAQKVDIVDYTSESNTDGLSVYIAASGAGGGQDAYELHVFSPTEYRFGTASN